MSEFDKEAERERLREKFDRDEEKRADTKRMSELLLKGATMTNRHCDTCGDPLFRYDGQEFCPTCQSREAGATEPVAESPESNDTATPAAETSPDTAGQRETPTADVETGGGRERTDELAAEPGDDREESTPAARPETNGRTPANPDAPTRAAENRESETRGDLTDARASLVRALSTHASAAESAADPRVAKDHLSAAREAAEALRALDGR